MTSPEILIAEVFPTRSDCICRQLSESHLAAFGSASDGQAAIPEIGSPAASLALTAECAPINSPSSRIHAAEEVPGLGCFKTYEDGRVRALFSDRTILSLDRERTLAHIILPSGIPVQVCLLFGFCLYFHQEAWFLCLHQSV